MAEYSEFLRGKIVILNEEGYSQQKIAERLKISKTGVRKTLQRLAKTGSTSSKPRSGRPRISSSRTDNVIHRLAVINPTISSSEIQAELPKGENISCRTIRRRLRDEFKLGAYRPAIKPRLSAKNIKDRMSFCRRFRHFTAEDWETVLFSDETLIKQFAPHKKLVRRPPNQRFNPRYTSPSVKSPSSVMVWGCIASTGRGGLWLMPNKTTINSSVYLQILKDKLQTWLTLRNCTTFQHDGAPCHQAKSVKEWLNANGIQILSPWPGSSPDLNPIENAWVKLKTEVSKTNPSSVEELRKKVIQAWASHITPQYCRSLVRSIPSRISAVLAAKGQHTKY